MYQLQYADIQEDAVMDARSRERELMKRSIDLLKKASKAEQNSIDAVEAIHFTRRLWTALVDDLAQPDNELPQELRANLISIGIWILKEVERIRQGESDDFDGIIEISDSIRKGIR